MNGRVSGRMNGRGWTRVKSGWVSHVCPVKENGDAFVGRRRFDVLRADLPGFIRSAEHLNFGAMPASDPCIGRERPVRRV